MRSDLFRRATAGITALALFAAVNAVAQQPAASAPAAAPQQTTGAPCSPAATTTIAGDKIPAAEPPFGGVIKDAADQSKPCWPPKDRAAQGRAERPADHDGRRRLRCLRAPSAA